MTDYKELKEQIQIKRKALEQHKDSGVAFWNKQLELCALEESAISKAEKYEELKAKYDKLVKGIKVDEKIIDLVCMIKPNKEDVDL